MVFEFDRRGLAKSCNCPIFAANLVGAMYKISFKFEQEELESVILESVEPGYSLLELALNNKIPLEHICGGMCACSTCHVFIEEGQEYLEEISKREKHFVDRVVGKKINSRLSCQCVLQKGKGTVTVIVPHKD